MIVQCVCWLFEYVHTLYIASSTLLKLVSNLITCSFPACEAGYFRSVGMDACTICPTNSNSTTEAVSTCDCDFYFFRNDTEDETAACTSNLFSLRLKCLGEFLPLKLCAVSFSL